MSFTTIPSDWINPGEALKKRLFLRIKDNFDDHETRLNAIEGGLNKISVFNFEVCGYLSNYEVADLVGIATYTAAQDLILSNIQIILLDSVTTEETSSSSGKLEIDIERSTDNGVTWETILSVRPSIDSGVSGVGSSSSTFSFVPGPPSGANIEEGTILRLNISSKKDSQGSFMVNVFADIS